MRKWASASSHALARLKIFADEFILDGSFALVAFGPGKGAEAVDADVALFALGPLIASEGVVGLTNLADVRPAVVVDVIFATVFPIFFLRLASSGARFIFLDFLSAVKQRGDIEVVERQRIHHLPLQSRIFAKVLATKTCARLHRIRTHAFGAFVKIFASLKVEGVEVVENE